MNLSLRRVVSGLRSRAPKLMALLEGELPMVEPANLIRTGSASWEGLIPGTIFQTWEDRLFGKTHARVLEKFRALNPEFDFAFFDRNERDAYMAEFYANHPILEVYKRAKIGSMKVDIWRYCIIFERGGLYFDINKCIEAPLNQIIRLNDESIISFESNLLADVRPRDSSACLPLECSQLVKRVLLYSDRPLLNWGFGFVAGHPFLESVIQNIVTDAPYYQGKVFRNARDPVIELTGPHMFTRSVYQALERNPDINFRQIGIDFEGFGNPNVKGSWVRYVTSKSYARSHGVVVLE